MIFDLDGTLVDTLADITAGVNAGLTGVGFGPRAPSEVRRWVGDGVAKLLERALPTAYHDRIAEVQEVVVEHYRQHTMDHAKLYPGIAELLDELESAPIRLAVLSNKPHEFTVQIVAGMLNAWSIDGVLGCIDPDKRKPDPSGVLSLAEHMELTVDSVVLVGDSGTDIQTARNAGVRSVAVTWGFRDRDELEAAGPTWLIDRPADLLAILREEGALGG